MRRAPPPGRLTHDFVRLVTQITQTEEAKKRKKKILLEGK